MFKLKCSLRAANLSLLVLMSLVSQQGLAQDSAVGQPAADSNTQQSASAANNSDSSTLDTNKLIRPKYTDELNKESSSFVADPDSLDPLPLKKETLKEDEEPVLDDIKSILKTKNLPSAKKTKAKETTQNNEQPAPVKVTPKAKPVKAKVSQKKKKSISKNIQKKPKVQPVVVENTSVDLNDDSPDYIREQKFHSVYKKFNATPTSNETWGKVTTADKTVNVYVVQKGDTLASISETLFGDTKFWPKIWAINNVGIANPHQIYPGQKIYFLEGSASSAPVMQVGENSELAQAAQEKNDDKSDDNESDDAGEVLGKYERQHTEFSSNNELLLSTRGRKKTYHRPPASLPLTVSNEYLTPSKPSVTILDFDKKEVADSIVVNPYILTSNKIKSDLKIKESDIEKLLCRDGHYIPPVIEVVGEESLQTKEYLILVREDFKFSNLKDTYAYRRNGSVVLNADGSLRVQKCIENSTSDVILITQESLGSQVVVPNEIISKYNSGNRILDGFVVYGQSLFSSHQFALLNADRGDIKDGDVYNIYSDEAGQNVGQIKIMHKTGTVAIGYILNSTNIIKDGDKIVP